MRVCASSSCACCGGGGLRFFLRALESSARGATSSFGLYIGQISSDETFDTSKSPIVFVKICNPIETK